MGHLKPKVVSHLGHVKPEADLFDQFKLAGNSIVASYLLFRN